MYNTHSLMLAKFNQLLNQGYWLPLLLLALIIKASNKKGQPITLDQCNWLNFSSIKECVL